MDSPKVLDMPMKHWETVDTREKADKINNYCILDTKETKKQILINKGDLELRRQVKKEYPDLNPFVLSDTAIGRETMLIDYCKITGDLPEDIAKLETKYESIKLKDVISDKIKFKTKKLQNFLEYLKSKRDNLVYKSLSETIEFDGIRYELKKGGLHSIHKNFKDGYRMKNILFKSNEAFKILDFDFGSYYPMLIAKLGIAPKHLNTKVFCDLVYKYTQDRLVYKKKYKETDDLIWYIRQWALKIKINSLFGLLGAKYGFLQDQKAMYQVTLNGQLFLLMLIEAMASKDMSCFYANTDGCTFMVPKESENDFYRICQAFESQVIDIPQEFVEYNRCYISDVNNYCIIDSEGELKLKGRYEWKPKFMMETKNNSNRVSRKAAVKFLTQNVPLKRTIDSETNLYYFCIGHKATKSPKQGQAEFRLHNLSDPKFYERSNILQKNIRYIITEDSNTLIKKYYPEVHDKKGSFLDAYPDKKITNQWRQQLMLDVKSEDLLDYNIDWKYYYREAHKLVQFRELEKFAIVNQLKLF